MANYAQHVAAPTPQSEQAHPDQRPNNAGGYSFTVDKWKRLDRFLLLGNEGGTYYVSERKLTIDNAKAVRECLAEDAPRTIARIAEVSDRGLAPKNDAAIFALALAVADKNPETRKAALAQLPVVCRIGTHLFHFVQAIDAFGCWGRSVKRAVANWYLDKSPDQLAYQMVKYQQRDGWSHKDVLRLSHANADDLSHDAAVCAPYKHLFTWACENGVDARAVKRKRATGVVTKEYPALPAESRPKLLDVYKEIHSAKSTETVVKLITEHRLTHEMVPNEHKGSRDVWAALLERMPIGAMVRNLGKMTSIDLVKDGSDASRKVAAVLADREIIRKARLHPIALLSALKVYQQGHGDKGSLKWNADRKIVDALNDAFYLAFETVVPTGKRIMLALDVSGSMNSPCGVAGLSCAEASAAIAMTIARTEQDWACHGFTTEFKQLDISPRQRLDDVLKRVSNINFGGTDCSLPMLWAERNRVAFDAFIVLTDSETYAGNMHPHEALVRYRKSSGIAAKEVVCGMTATNFTIADPNDAGTLDVAGMSTDVPMLIADFIREG